MERLLFASGIRQQAIIFYRQLTLCAWFRAGFVPKCQTFCFLQVAIDRKPLVDFDEKRP